MVGYGGGRGGGPRSKVSTRDDGRRGRGGGREGEQTRGKEGRGASEGRGLVGSEEIVILL